MVVVARHPHTSSRAPAPAPAPPQYSSQLMPAAGDLSSAMRPPLLGKHRLSADDAAASTGDAGPAAKRPRNEREFAMRFFAFNDWTSCLKPDEQGNVPLHCAVLLGDLNRIKRLCCVLRARDHSLDICNNDGETPLHLAVIHRLTKAVEVLIKFGAKPQFRDSAGNTSFHLAVQRDAQCLDILRCLLTAPELKKADIELYNDDGYTPLHLTAMYGKADELQALIHKGVDVNLKDTKSGRTPLFHAVETNSALCCRILLANGANSTEQNYAGHTPIIAASEFGNNSIHCAMPHQNYKRIQDEIIMQLEKGRR